MTLLNKRSHLTCKNRVFQRDRGKFSRKYSPDWNYAFKILNAWSEIIQYSVKMQYNVTWLKKKNSKSLSFFYCLLADVFGALVKNSSFASSAAPAAETGSLLPVQRCGSDAAHVRVCSPGSLDGLRLVCHRTCGDRKQRPCYLGHR